MRALRAAALLATAGAALLPVGTALAAPGDNVRISLSDTEAQPAQESTGSALSADGRYALFTSRDSLTGVNVANVLQLYVRDRVAGTTRLVSANAAGNPAAADVDESAMDHPYAISGDGRYATFASTATNLVAADTNGAQNDVFVKDLVTGTVTVASVNDAGQQANVGVQGNPDISGDGRRVAFVTGAGTTNLFPNDTNNAMDVVVRDLTAGKTLLASQSSAGVLANDFTERPAISADGRVVVFEAFMGTINLVADDDNAASDIYRRDLEAGTTARISIATDGTDPGNTNFPDVSGTGRYVAFQSSNKFDPVADGNATIDVYRRDATAGTTTLVSAVNGGTTAAASGDSREPVISADGSRVAFQSTANLLPPDGNLTNADVYVRDIPLNAVQRANSPQANNSATGASVSGNGAFVGFNYNDAPTFDFMAGDTNDLTDVFAHEFARSDSAGPVLALTEPADGSSTTASEVTVAGSASDESGIVAVTVGGEGVPASFSRTVPLEPGANTITVTALDGAGNTTSVARTVTRTLPPTDGGDGGGGADTTPPTGTVNGKSKQDVDKLALTVGSNEDAALSGQASVNVPGGKKPVTSKTATANVPANGTAKLKFKFKKKTLKKIKKVIAKGKKPKAKIAVTFTDAAGNQATANKTVKLKD